MSDFASSGDDRDLDELLTFLREERGFDFTEYKKSSISRRVDRRMKDVGVSSIAGYREYLQAHPAEFPFLLDALLINVTDFFRDAGAWAALTELLAPRVAAAIDAERQFRVWCPGCATGEEAYTLAIVLAELMGEDAFRASVRIFATDIDENALVRARSGNYSARSMESLDPVLRDRYFEQDGASYVFRSDLRPMLTFGRHDLTADPPISRLDLLSFRNTLIYFNVDLQSRILQRFRTAIVSDGLLFLGRSESLVMQQAQFRTLDAEHRIFTPVPRGAVSTAGLGADLIAGRVEGGAIGSVVAGAAQAGPFAQFVIDLDGQLVGANAMARAQFSVHSNDLGRPFTELAVAGLPLDLESVIETAHATGVSQSRVGVERLLANDQIQYLDIVVVPLIDESGAPSGSSVVFVDTSEVVRLRLERDLAVEELQAVTEELRASTQELQSTNEELETSNEEFQSMNEELETTNDELNSALSDVKKLNESLVRRTDAGNVVTARIVHILDGLAAGVIVIDERFEISYLNGEAERMLGVARGDVLGAPFTSLALELPGSDLDAVIRRAVAGEDYDHLATATSGVEDPVECRLVVSAGRDPEAGSVVLLMLLEDARR